MNRLRKLATNELSKSDQRILIFELLFRFMLIVFAVIGLIWQKFLLTNQGTLFYHSMITLLITLIAVLGHEYAKVRLDRYDGRFDLLRYWRIICLLHFLYGKKKTVSTCSSSLNASNGPDRYLSLLISCRVFLPVRKRKDCTAPFSIFKSDSFNTRLVIPAYC